MWAKKYFRLTVMIATDSKVFWTELNWIELNQVSSFGGLKRLLCGEAGWNDCFAESRSGWISGTLATLWQNIENLDKDRPAWQLHTYVANISPKPQPRHYLARESCPEQTTAILYWKVIHRQSSNHSNNYRSLKPNSSLKFVKQDTPSLCSQTALCSQTHPWSSYVKPFLKRLHWLP